MQEWPPSHMTWRVYIFQLYLERSSIMMIKAYESNKKEIEKDCWKKLEATLLRSTLPRSSWRKMKICSILELEMRRWMTVMENWSVYFDAHSSILVLRHFPSFFCFFYYFIVLLDLSSYLPLIYFCLLFLILAVIWYLFTVRIIT